MITVAEQKQGEQGTPQAFDPTAFNAGRIETISKGVAPSQQAAPAAPVVQQQQQTPAEQQAVVEEAAQYRLTLSEQVATRLTQRLGITEATQLTEDSLIQFIDGIEQREGNLRTQLIERGVFDSPEIQSIEAKLKMDKATAVKESLMAHGLSEEDAAEQVDILTGTGGIDKMHEKYVARLEANKQTEIERLKAEHATAIDNASRGLNGSMSDEDRVKLSTLLNEQLKDVSTIAGASFGSTPDEVAANKAAHVEYLVSGKFEKDLRADPAVYAQMAFIFRNLKTIQSVAMSKGAEMGKAAVLERLQQPSNVKQGNALVPAGADGKFDPVAFNQGRAQAQAESVKARTH